MDFYANLHLHSTHSDGAFTPEELVRAAKDEGYRAIALTDHDTVSGNAEIHALCEANGMESLFGAEFTVGEPYPFHIVGFDFDPEMPEMKEYLRLLSLRETEKTHQLFDIAVAAGAIRGITWEEVPALNPGVTWLCGEHIWRAMRKKNLVREEDEMAWFKENIHSKKRQIVCTIQRKNAADLIDLIHRSGGIAVLAHPAERLQDLEHAEEVLIPAGLDGVEVWHADLSAEERAAAFAFGKKHGLYLSGGSDHRGLCSGIYSCYNTEEELKAGPYYIPPRSCGAPREFFNALRDRKKPDYK